MRQVALQMGMSLDGYVASDREHPGASVAEDAELVGWKLDRVAKAGAHLMGRTSTPLSRRWRTPICRKHRRQHRSTEGCLMARRCSMTWRSLRIEPRPDYRAGQARGWSGSSGTDRAVITSSEVGSAGVTTFRVQSVRTRIRFPGMTPKW